MYKKPQFNYIFSLLPSHEHLSDLEQLNIHVRSEIDPPQSYLPYANPVNAHQYKPVYKSRSETSKTLECFVATPLVARHVANGWEQYSQMSGHNVLVNFVFDKKLETKKHYKDLIKNFFKEIPIKDTVIFARLDSVISYLRMKILLDKYKVKSEKVKKLFVRLEKHRLKHGLLNLHQEQIYKQVLGEKLQKQLFEDMPLNPVYSGSFVWGQNINFNGKEISIINLPWGRDLAESIASSMPKKKLKKVYIVGGVGCILDDIDIDELFIPTDITNTNGIKVKFKNHFSNESKVHDFLTVTKRISNGTLCCVDSSLSTKSGFSKWAKEKGIGAFDMESLGFMKVFSKYNIPVAMVYYVMDLPHKGLGLSRTYYSKPFLTKLLSDPNRGKYFCFNIVFEDILNG